MTDCTEINSEDFEDFCFGVFESTSLVDIISFFFFFGTSQTKEPGFIFYFSPFCEKQSRVDQLLVAFV